MNKDLLDNCSKLSLKILIVSALYLLLNMSFFLIRKGDPGKRGGIIYLLSIILIILAYVISISSKFKNYQFIKVKKVFEISFAIYFIYEYIIFFILYNYKFNFIRNSNIDFSLLLITFFTANVISGYIIKFKVHYILAVASILEFPIIYLIFKDCDVTNQILLAVAGTIRPIIFFINFLFLWLAYFIKLRTMKKKEIVETGK